MVFINLMNIKLLIIVFSIREKKKNDKFENKN
jgi:hypothetical protein